MLLDEKVNANFDKLNDNDLQIAHFVNTHVNQCKTLKIHELHNTLMHLTLPFIDLHES